VALVPGTHTLRDVHAIAIAVESWLPEVI
jgi:hypothetical protein